MPSEPLLPPRQTRSRQTLERILEAAAGLLEDRSFEELTVADVVAAAGCSVGTFYGRLRDKEALLHALDERYFRQFEAVVGDFLDSEILARGTLLEVLEQLAELLLRFHTRHRGLVRALVLHARIHRDPKFESREGTLWQNLAHLVERLLRFEREIAHEEPETALVFALLQMLYTLREMTLWPRISRRVPVATESLGRELARSAHAYLTTGSPWPVDPIRR